MHHEQCLNLQNGHTKVFCFLLFKLVATHLFCVNSPNGIWQVSQAIGNSSHPLRSAIECRWSGWQTAARAHLSIQNKALGWVCNVPGRRSPRRKVCKTLQGRALTFNAPSRDACKFSSVWQSDFRGRRALKGGGRAGRRHDNFTPRHLRALRQNFCY
jgi:hypothetical protein